GLVPRTLAARRRLPALVQRRAPHRHARNSSDLFGDGARIAKMTAFRLPAGGRIDRDRRLAFSFDGRPLSGFQGDTLASALLANDVLLVARSFKYHRPRAVMSAGVEETNALVAVGEGGRLDTNTRATTLELHDGLKARSLNRWPSLGFDLSAMNGWLAPVLVAGFYYKTFMWPRWLWHSLYEPLIRRMAGIGSAP